MLHARLDDNPRVFVQELESIKKRRRFTTNSVTASSSSKASYEATHGLLNAVKLQALAGGAPARALALQNT